MTKANDHPAGELLRATIWTLRITVALECLGNWRWLTRIEETPLLSWLHDPHDIGGLAWNESTALATQHTIGWLALIAGVLILIRPCSYMLWPLVFLQALLATAMWQVDDGFPLEIAGLPAWLCALFPYATQSARIIAPLGLLLLDPWHSARPMTKKRVDYAIALLRWAAAIAFAAHGIEAWQHHFVFTDLLIGSAQQLIGMNLSQSWAEGLLSVIAVVDLAAAIACITTRIPAVLWWMAVWGGITAISRVVANGWEPSWHTMLTRAPHFGVPLAVVLYWHLLRLQESQSATLAATPENHSGSD